VAKKTGRRRGGFVVIEGPDGCGKTTQARRLANYLGRLDRKALLLREPGGTEVGERIRRVLLNPRSKMSFEAELLLYMASRAQLVREVILPALKAGRDVVCDRFLLSSLVYQGYAGGLDIETLKTIGNFAAGGLQPDATVVLKLPLSVAMRRRRKTPDRIESRAQAFHRRVMRGYITLAKENPEKIFIIDSTRPVNVVQQEIRDTIGRMLP